MRCAIQLTYSVADNNITTKGRGGAEDTAVLSVEDSMKQADDDHKAAKKGCCGGAAATATARRDPNANPDTTIQVTPRPPCPFSCPSPSLSLHPSLVPNLMHSHLHHHHHYRHHYYYTGQQQVQATLPPSPYPPTVPNLTNTYIFTTTTTTSTQGNNKYKAAASNVPDIEVGISPPPQTHTLIYSLFYPRQQCP